MAVEAATYVSQLVSSNPPGSDPKSQGDNHIRLVKAALQATFPNASRPSYIGGYSTKSATVTLAATDIGSVISVNPGASITITLPTPPAAAVGATIGILRTDTNMARRVAIAPASGTINGETNIGVWRQYYIYRFVWTGSAWICANAPLAGIVLDFAAETPPPGYVLCYGQAYSSTTYKELFAAIGGSTLPDLRGRVVAGWDSMGGTSSNRLTAAGGGLNGDSIGAAGGYESVTLTLTQIPAHTHTFSDTTSGAGGHSHQISYNSADRQGGGSGTVDNLQDGTSGANDVTTTSVGNHTHSISGTTSSAGSGADHSNIQPTYVLNKIISLG